jgi:hypothetical protein
MELQKFCRLTCRRALSDYTFWHGERPRTGHEIIMMSPDNESVLQICLPVAPVLLLDLDIVHVLRRGDQKAFQRYQSLITS